MRARLLATRGRPRRPAILAAPAQGASSLLLYLLMLLVVGIAVADARRLVAPGSTETFAIPILMAAAGLAGFVLARSSLGILRAHLLGATLGASLILMAVAARVAQAPHALTLDPEVVSERMRGLWAEMIRLSQSGPDAGLADRWPLALLVLAAICWTTGQFGAFSIFRYDRGAPAVVAAGLVLLLNVSFPNAHAGLAVLPAIVAFALLALLLFMRMHLGHQQAEWARRNIADTRDVTRLFLRTGVAFVLVATVGASTLTAVAVSDRGDLPLPQLGGPLDDLRDRVLDLLGDLGIVVPGPDPGPEDEFAERQEIADSWDKGDGIRFRASTDRAATTYWWGAAYATFDGTAWTQGPARRRVVRPGEAIPSGGLEIPDRSGLPEQRGRVSADITAVSFAMSTLLAPATAVRAADRSLALRTSEPGGARTAVDFERRVEPGETYSVTSLVLGDEGASEMLTADDLRSAGSRYPEGLQAYLEVRGRASGPRTRQFAARIEQDVRGTAADNAYDKAVLAQARLREYRYEPDMVGVCGDLAASECLFASGKGFCQHFASAMAMALREMGIPSRLVHGYLPGEIIGPQLVDVPLQAAHAWVEVFFPGFGWTRFDPTPGLEALGGQPTELPEEDPGGGGDDRNGDRAGPTFEPMPPEATIDPEPSPGVTPAGPPGAPGTPDLAGLLLATLVGLTVAGLGLLALAVVALRRLPGADPELAYRGVVSLATRLGHGPHPSQTAYEYVGELADTLPSVRGDLELVARVRVESAYARRLVGPDSLAALRHAYARVRTRLLRLILRR